MSGRASDQIFSYGGILPDKPHPIEPPPTRRPPTRKEPPRRKPPAPRRDPGRRRPPVHEPPREEPPLREPPLPPGEPPPETILVATLLRGGPLALPDDGQARWTGWPCWPREGSVGEDSPQEAQSTSPPRSNPSMTLDQLAWSSETTSSPCAGPAS
jgi:hypothetical protein